MASGRGYGSVNKHVALAHGVSYVFSCYFMFILVYHLICVVSSCTFVLLNVQGDSAGKDNMLGEEILWVIVRKKVHLNMCLILNGY
jgi:hypothetical protein